MNPSKKAVDKASEKTRILDTATQELLRSTRKKNSLAVTSFVVCWSILLIVGIFGIFKQNEIANQNKTHIDCIVKLLATPQKPGTTHKFITDASQTCNIKFN